MGFRFTKPPLQQGLTSLVLVACALLVFSLPGTEALWARWVQQPTWLTLPVTVVLLHHGLFWTMAGAFAWVEKTGRPAFVARHRVQSGRPRRPGLGRTLRLLALNQLVLTPLMMTALWGVLHLRGWTPTPDLPGTAEVLWDLAQITVLSAVWFYASHRFLHRPWWMKRVHRVHHEFRTPSCLAAEYAHPVEMVLGNFGTLAVGVVVVLPDLATLYVYTVLATLTFVGHHSGYALPWMSWSVHHDWHHFRYKEAFGTFGVLDQLLGTQPELSALQDGQEVR